MQPLRARLAASRPGAAAYITTLAQMPEDMARLEGRLAGVTIYPVKGLGGLQVTRARVDRAGLVDVASGLADRGVLLAVLKGGETGEGEVFDGYSISNRLESAFALTRSHMDAKELVYEASGVTPLRLDPSSLTPCEGPTTRVRLFDGGPIVEGVRDDGALAPWVRALLRTHERRRRFDPDDVVVLRRSTRHRRAVVDKHRAGQEPQTLFGDGGHMVVASAGTLDWMNDAISAAGTRAVDMEAFRPNLVVNGWLPNVEDIIGEIEVDGHEGAVPILFASLCTRCDATRVDIRTGEKSGREPLAFLAKERPPRDGEPQSTTFAVNAVAPAVAEGRTLGVGDRVRVLSERVG